VSGRQRASQARDAFARVGTAPVSANASQGESLSASGNNDEMAGNLAVRNAGSGAGSSASGSAGSLAGKTAGRTADGKAGRKAGRRVGRPRGPARVPLTIRILASTDARLTMAVEATGESPQYIVDAALATYLDKLGI